MIRHSKVGGDAEAKRKIKALPSECSPRLKGSVAICDNSRTASQGRPGERKPCLGLGFGKKEIRNLKDGEGKGWGNKKKDLRRGAQEKLVGSGKSRKGKRVCKQGH